jgi:hypothetical protein
LFNTHIKNKKGRTALDEAEHREKKFTEKTEEIEGKWVIQEYLSQNETEQLVQANKKAAKYAQIAQLLKEHDSSMQIEHRPPSVLQSSDNQTTPKERNKGKRHVDSDSDDEENYPPRRGSAGIPTVYILV